GSSELEVTRICLGTMTFGQQVDEATSQQLLAPAVARGITFIDSAEMYPVPPSAPRFGWTETCIGNWFGGRPGMRDRVVLATKVSGPARGYEWIRKGNPDLT